MPQQRNMAYRRSYINYKRTQEEGRKAAIYGDVSPVVAEELFLKQAKLRLQHCNRFFSGKWDEGHKRAYDIALGTAWIHRQHYEDEKAERDIDYNRTTKKKPEKYSLWRKKSKKTPTFNQLLAEHKKIAKSRKN